MRTWRHESEVIEEALREHLGLAAIERMRTRADLDERMATRLANEAVHETRRDRRRDSV
jgi:hypothetical protein